MKSGIELIREERVNQIQNNEYCEQPDTHNYDDGQLVDAAIIILEDGNKFVPDGWNATDFKSLTLKSKIERLTIAGALCAAEIDRLQSI